MLGMLTLLLDEIDSYGVLIWVESCFLASSKCSSLCGTEREDLDAVQVRALASPLNSTTHTEGATRDEMRRTQEGPVYS